MKFDTRALTILRNFTTINESIVFNPGSIIQSISPSRTILVKAKINTEVPVKFGVYDLGRFLSSISLFNEPDIHVDGKSVVIAEGNEKLNYTASEPSLIMTPPDKNIQLQSVDVKFNLESDTLTRVMKALSIIGVPEIVFTGDGKNIYLEALNSRDQSASNYKVQVGETDKTFKFIFLAENIKLLPGSYEVSVSSRGISHFKGDDIEYWVSVESNSTYEG